MLMRIWLILQVFCHKLNYQTNKTDDGARWSVMGSPKLLSFMQRWTWISVPNSSQCIPLCVHHLGAINVCKNLYGIYLLGFLCPDSWQWSERDWKSRKADVAKNFLAEAVSQFPKTKTICMTPPKLENMFFRKYCSLFSTNNTSDWLRTK